MAPRLTPHAPTRAAYTVSPTTRNPAPNPAPEAPPPAPLHAPLCPLCGQANECAASASGSFDGPCWCTGVSFSAELLAQVAPQQQQAACICRQCAQTQPAPGLHSAGHRPAAAAAAAS
ncbi:MAG: cysteine-rich CWC family protein [Pseudomonadota bacterium]